VNLRNILRNSGAYCNAEFNEMGGECGKDRKEEKCIRGFGGNT
jgi:hypothetical protein